MVVQELEKKEARSVEERERLDKQIPEKSGQLSHTELVQYLRRDLFLGRNKTLDEGNGWRSVEMSRSYLIIQSSPLCVIVLSSVLTQHAGIFFAGRMQEHGKVCP